jgi:hypothetical protein
MEIKYRLKHQLKLYRWLMRRFTASIRWGAESLHSTPAVLGNAMPKSGSHLIIQVLKGLTNIGPFVDPGMPPVNRGEDNRKLSEIAILANIQQMKAGDIAYGYIHARQPFISVLTASGRATVFVYRDPRDMIISHVFYATQIQPKHGMRHYYTEVLTSIEDRINAAILGVDEPGSELSSVRQKYENYLGWLDKPEVLSLRFEDLILNRDATLERLLDYLKVRGYLPKIPYQEAVDRLKQAIVPKKSGTFRKAQPGNWREYFTPANKALFKEVSGDLLVSLGYEASVNW